MNILASAICDSLFLAPEMSDVYVEFLLEKRRSVKLQHLYEEMYKVTTEETLVFMAKYNIDTITIIKTMCLSQNGLTKANIVLYCKNQL